MRARWSVLNKYFSRELSLIVCSTSVSSHGWKAFRGLDSQAFLDISLKGELFRKLGVWNSVATFHMSLNGGDSVFFNSLMEMTSSVADIICIAQITFKLIYNTLSANDGWFPLLNFELLANLWTREYRLYWVVNVVAKIFKLFSDEIFPKKIIIFAAKFAVVPGILR